MKTTDRSRAAHVLRQTKVLGVGPGTLYGHTPDLKELRAAVAARSVDEERPAPGP
ncbi:hypothetical protein ACFWTE_15650 [Nocardiopsis sp. NPDC058631]|uniref:hypothetical protein n=1 Tax=Nocardiopsis sp. NPDC058631 TaxID=3346566 RepID=UPI0036475F26